MKVLKNQKGITLITLIIVVVIAIVTIQLISNKNNDAGLENINKSLTENELEETNMIKRYILGEKEVGMPITNIAEMYIFDEKVVWSFIDDKETEINEGNIKPVFTDLKYDPYVLYAKFNNITYKIRYDATTCITKSVEVAYRFEGREGEEIKYDSNGDGIDEDWIIITDREGKVEIVSKDVAKDEYGNTLTIGLDNVSATTDISGDGNIDDTDTAILSYNNAITTINNFCKTIVKKEIRDKVRSVGGQNNNTESYHPEKYGKWGNNIKVEIASGDEYYKEDYEKMKYLGILSTGDDWYWMSSRTTGFAFGNPEVFRLKCISGDGILRRNTILECEFQL